MSTVKKGINFEPKTDQEIYDMAMAEWVGILSQLWEAIGKPVDGKQLAVYTRQLGDVPMGVLEGTVKRLMQEHTYNSVPSLGDIWVVIRKYYGEPHMLQFWKPEPRVDKYAEVEG
jgi:hypothetical protein